MKTEILHPLVAHRGDHQYHPENSLAAFRQALEAGACWLECDVQITGDGVPVIFHDDDLRRMCGLERNIADLSCDELPTLAHGQGIPKMAELLTLLAEFPRATLFLEVKTSILQRYTAHEAVAKLEAMIAANPQVVPISFSAELLAVWWHYRPQQLGWLGDDCEKAPKIPLAFLFMSADAFLGRGCPPISDLVGVYTVNDVAFAQQLLLRSADLVETDHFSQMRMLLYGK